MAENQESLQNQRHSDQDNVQRIFQDDIALEREDHDQRQQQANGGNAVELLDEGAFKICLALLLITKERVSMPPARGITTNRTTDRISVSQGTGTLDTPRRNFTMGTKANRMIGSLVAT